MKVNSTWKVQVDAKSEAGAKKLAKRCASKVGLTPYDVSVDEHPREGYLVDFEFRHEADQQWPDVVIEMITLGQKLGTGWLLEGDVQDFLGGILSEEDGGKFLVKGLLWANWVIVNEFSD